MYRYNVAKRLSKGNGSWNSSVSSSIRMRSTSSTAPAPCHIINSMTPSSTPMTPTLTPTTPNQRSFGSGSPYCSFGWGGRIGFATSRSWVVGRNHHPQGVPIDWGVGRRPNYFSTSTTRTGMDKPNKVPERDNDKVQNDNNNSNNDDATTTKKGEPSKQEEKKKKKDDSNVFLDNMGKIFFAVIGSIILALVRSSRGQKNRTDLLEKMERESLLDPLEIDDLRRMNPQFTPSVFTEVREATFRAFPSGRATYTEFVPVVLHAMRQAHANGSGSSSSSTFTIDLGHLLDRVVLGCLRAQREQRAKEPSTIQGDNHNHTSPSEEDGKENDNTLPLPLLLVILSLALNSSVDDRIRLLFDVMVQSSSLSSSSSSSGLEDEGERVVTDHDVAQMVDYLQQTCQLACDPQILPTDVKYPVQEYKVGSPGELTWCAKNEVAGSGVVPTFLSAEKEALTLDDFESILCTTYVCAWGECYGSKRKMPAPS